MVWGCFKKEQRGNLKSFEHENGRKMPNRKTEIKMQKTGYERRQADGRRAWKETAEEFWEERDRQTHLASSE
jgi:hypothetical protein